LFTWRPFQQRAIRLLGLILLVLLSMLIAGSLAIVLLVHSPSQAERDFLQRIDVLMAGKRYAQAEAELAGRYPTAAKRNAEIWLRLGIAQSMQGHFESAAQSLDHGLDISPDDPRLLFNRALLYDRTQQPAQAEKMLLSLKQKAPYFPEVFYHLGRLAEDRGDFKAADSYYIRELNLNPASQSSWSRHLLLSQRNPQYK